MTSLCGGGFSTFLKLAGVEFDFSGEILVGAKQDEEERRVTSELEIFFP